MQSKVLRLPRRQVDTLHADVRRLVLQFQMSLGATRQGSLMLPRLPARVSKKVPVLPFALPPKNTDTVPPLSPDPHPPALLACTYPELPLTPLHTHLPKQANHSLNLLGMLAGMPDFSKPT